MSGSMHACISAVVAASGKDNLSEAELDRIFTRAQNRTRFYTGQGMDPLAAARRAGTELGDEMRLAAAVEKRSEAINMLARRRLDARVQPGRAYQSVLATLTGVARGTWRGAADSIDAAWHGLRNQMLGGLKHDLSAAGLLDVLRGRDAALERDIARELWRVRDPSMPGSGNAHAEQAAQILAKYQEAVRNGLNDAGGWIGKLDNYITRQSHDTLKVRGDGSDAAFARWRDFILPRLDPVTFRDAENPETLLRNIWLNLSSGVHTTSTSETLAGFKGPASVAKRVSQERVLHFKDADAWYDYNGAFGRGRVVDAVLAQIEKGTRDIALMRTLGTNPEAMLTGWVDRLRTAARDAGDFKASDQLGSNFPQQVLRVLDGRAAVPASANLAKIGQGVRVMNELSKLGGVVLSSLPDLAVNAAMLRHNGIPLFHAYAAEMAGLLPRGAETREVADMLGVGVDQVLRSVASRFRAEDGMPGQLARASELFYRVNGLAYWTDALKEASGLMLSSNLAENAGKNFGALNIRLQSTLRRYGIEEAEWNQIRAAPQRAADGRNYILPEAVGAEDASRKLQAYIIDQVREGMTEASAGTRAVMTLGTQAGTWAGEAVRLLGQFKTYATTYLMRTIGREVYRDGIDVGGAVHLVAATTALGYLALTLKELAKGRNPRQPDDASTYAKTVAAALVQGGGLGIYGDFLFGENNRFGGGIIDTLAGPSAGATSDVFRFLAQRVRGEGNTAAEALRLGVNHAPFVNLFYTRAALDYLVLYRMQEWANPGYLRRYEQRIKRENDQTFWLRPTDAVR